MSYSVLTQFAVIRGGRVGRVVGVARLVAAEAAQERLPLGVVSATCPFGTLTPDAAALPSLRGLGRADGTLSGSFLACRAGQTPAPNSESHSLDEVPALRARWTDRLRIGAAPGTRESKNPVSGSDRCNCVPLATFPFITQNVCEPPRSISARL